MYWPSRNVLTIINTLTKLLFAEFFGGYGVGKLELFKYFITIPKKFNKSCVISEKFILK